MDDYYYNTLFIMPRENNHPKDIYKIILAARRLLLVSHRKPDGDTLGANLGFYFFLKTLPGAREIFIFCADDPSALYRFIPGVSLIKTDRNIFNQPFDVIMTFDAGDLEVTNIADELEAQRQAGAVLLDFDHHATNVRFGDYNYVLTDAASSTEVIFRFITANGGSINPSSATCLLTGLVTDTGFFSNGATHAQALNVSKQLLSLGADYYLIQERLLKDKSMFIFQLWGQAFERLTYNENYNIAWTYLTKDEIAFGPKDINVTDGLSNFLNSMLNVPAILVLKETPDGVSGSLRSTEAVDVGALAQSLGGGGHTRAAGFFLPGQLTISDDGCMIE